MRKRAAVLLVAVALLVSGCWDMTQIEDTIYVASIGVDVAGGEFIWTFRMVEPEKLALGMMTAVPGDPGRLASGVVSVRAHSLEQAVQLIQPMLSRIVSLEHVRWIAFGEDLARRGLSPVMGQFLRHYQVRRGVGVYVYRGEAWPGFTHNRPVGDTNALKFFESVRLVLKRLHSSPPIQMQHFYSRLMSPGVDPILALVGNNEQAQEPLGADLPPVGGSSFKAGETPRHGGNPVEYLGTAVFRGDRLVGMLNVDQTSALTALRGEMGKVYTSVPDPLREGDLITLRFHQENKPQFRASFSGTRPVINVKLQFEGEILSTPGQIDYTLPENRRLLEDRIAKVLKESTFTPMIDKVYHEWGADPVGFGQLFRTRFPTHDAWLTYKWPDHVKDVQVTVQIQMFIRRFGLLLGNPKAE